MIANRIMEYLETTGKDVAVRDLDVAARACRDSMERNLGIRRDDGSRKVRNPRPSGTWACGREMVFNSLGLETEGYGWRSRLTFTHGDMTEAMGVLVFRQAIKASGEQDILISPAADGTQLELEATLDPADWGVSGEPFALTGHLDMSVRGHQGEEEPADWKAIAEWTFKDMQRAAGDPEHGWWKKESSGYIAQVRWYMMMLRAMGRSSGKRGYLVGVNKNTGHITEVLIQADHEAEKVLILKAVYALSKIDEAKERQAIFEENLDHEIFENGSATKVMEEWVRKNIPRASFTENMVKECGPSTKRPDGTRGTCLELDTSKDADPQAFRCSYCDHTARCWPDFQVVPLHKPVWRTNG